MPTHAVRQDLGRPRGRARACSTSTCTSSTRSRARRPSTACASPAARSAAPTARSRPPTTTSRPTARRSRRASTTSSAASRSRRSSATATEFGVPLYSLGSDRQGIVHVIGPELGVTQPGMTIVCGDTHTATHGAFGALAFGIGTSEVEHVLATQMPRPAASPKSMRIRYTGELGFGVTAKDLILGTIGQMGIDGAAGHVVEYAGPAIEALSMEGRMTICNMTIEGGGRAGMIAPDETTFAWVDGRPGAPRGLRRRGRALARRCAPTTARRSTARSPSTPRALSPHGHLGHEPRPGRRRRRRGARARAPTADERALDVHGPRGRHADPGDQARPRLHRLVHELADRRPARRRGGRQGPQGRRRRQRDGRPGLRSRCKRRPRPRASTRSSARPASTGAAPAARCAWA